VLLYGLPLPHQESFEALSPSASEVTVGSASLRENLSSATLLKAAEGSTGSRAPPVRLAVLSRLLAPEHEDSSFEASFLQA
jgi:hypothetical protein